MDAVAFTAGLIVSRKRRSRGVDFFAVDRWSRSMFSADAVALATQTPS